MEWIAEHSLFTVNRGGAGLCTCLLRAGDGSLKELFSDGTYCLGSTGDRDHNREAATKEESPRRE